MTQPRTEWPINANSQAQIGALIAERFGIPCDQRYVHKWRTLVGVGDGTIPFPKAGARNSYNVAECFKWVEEHVIKRRAANDVAVSDKIESKTLKNRIDTKKLALLGIKVEKEEGRLISLSEAETRGINVITRQISAYKRTDEQYLPQKLDEKLNTLGIAPEIRSQVREWFTKEMESITTQREEMAEAYKTELKAELDALSAQEKANAAL